MSHLKSQLIGIWYVENLDVLLLFPPFFLCLPGVSPYTGSPGELDLRVVETISVKSYDHQVQSEAKILKRPAEAYIGSGDGILIVDDLVDTGKTFHTIRSLYPKAHFAAVYAKPLGKDSLDTFITEVSQDTWIFFPWDMALQYVAPYKGEG